MPRLPAARLVPACLALLTLSVTATACGKTDPAALRTKPMKPITKAHAADIAAAGVMARSDLKGYQATLAYKVKRDSFTRRLQTCAGLSTPMADVERDFTLDPHDITSEVAIAITADRGKRDVQRIGSENGRACLERLLRDEVRPPAGVHLVLRVSRVATHVVGVDATSGLRLRFTVSANGHSASFDGFYLAAAVGQAEITLFDASESGPSMSVGVAQELLTTLADRVRAANA